MLILFFSLFLLLLSLPLSPNYSSAHPATKLLFSFWSSEIFLPACRHGLRCCWLPKQPSRAPGIQICPAAWRPFCFLTRDVALPVGVMPGRMVGVHPASPSSRRLSAEAGRNLLPKPEVPLVLWCLFGLHGCCCRASKGVHMVTVTTSHASLSSFIAGSTGKSRWPE